MKKQNCWEFKKCRREPGGEHEKDMGVSPVTIAYSYGLRAADTILVSSLIS